MSKSQNLQKQVDGHKAVLAKSMETLKTIMGDSPAADRHAKMAMVAVRMNPNLAGCTQASVVYAVLQSASLGLEVGTVAGEAYLVPFGNECVLVPGYKGLIKQALRHPDVVDVVARCVYDGDEFSWHYGLDERLTHQPKGVTDPEKITHVYAICRKVTGAPTFVVLTREQIDERRGRAPGSKKRGGPWDTDFDKMAMKTAIKELSPFMPKTSTVDALLELETRQELGHATAYSPELDDIPGAPSIDADFEVVPEGETEVPPEEAKPSNVTELKAKTAAKNAANKAKGKGGKRPSRKAKPAGKKADKEPAKETGPTKVELDENGEPVVFDAETGEVLEEGGEITKLGLDDHGNAVDQNGNNVDPEVVDATVRGWVTDIVTDEALETDAKIAKIEKFFTSNFKVIASIGNGEARKLAAWVEEQRSVLRGGE